MIFQWNRKPLGFVVYGLALASIACAPKIEKLREDGRLFNYPYEVLRDDSLVRATDALGGDGSIAFSEVIPSGSQGSQHFEVLADLNDGGSLTLVTFADLDASKKHFVGGYRVQLTRTGDELSWFEWLSDDVVDRKPLERQIDKVRGVAIGKKLIPSALVRLRLNVDVHNDHGHHALWINDASLPFTAGRVPELTTNGEVVRSGPRWGLILQGATVHGIRIADPVIKD